MKVSVRLEKEKAVGLYEQMLLIRKFEEQSDRLYKSGKIRGFCHLYIGQEAIAVGAISTLRSDDYIITHYRDHGHALARGMDPKVVMAELMGKVTGSSRGLGGSMHLFDVEKRFMGGHAIVGGQLPLATGLALAIKQNKGDQVVLCFFGDGAVNEGEFHESMNLASMWNLPVLFFLENNLYGMGTHVDFTRSGGREIYTSADAYGIAATQVDGMDVLAVQEATKQAVQRIRSGESPVFIEAMCYRFKGHSVQDPMFYRDKEEVKKWETRDPIRIFGEKMINDGIFELEDIQRVAEDVGLVVSEAVDFADASDEPGFEAIDQNIYS
jgi:pyruvate dehydrogenase E1 component alpha subunit